MPSVASRLIVFALVAFALCAAARPAAGQTRSGSGRVYVSGSFLGDIKRFAGDPEEPVFDGESLGAGITVGTALAPRWDLQLGVDVPQFTTTSRERLVTLQKNVFSLQSVTETQTLSMTALVRLHGTSRHRIQVGYLAGISFVRLRRNAHTDAPAGTPAGLIPRPDASVSYCAAPTLGIDARIPVGARLALVPGLQATVASFSDTSGVIVRPRIGLRWTF